ncbi:mas-related G-protein coupled receptor member A1-like [Heptranchias perlo]|uniref:mas-related G-protein coupled receptor member A1-like n=1 Tax=Heptranchias perlo TaxID=212740 RepID=UPI00355A599D
MTMLCRAQPAFNVSLSGGATNGSWEHEATHHKHSTIISAMLILTFLLGTPLNGAALWVLGYKLKRKNRFVVYVLNLVVSDFLFLVFQAAHSVCLFSGVSPKAPALLVFRSLIVACNEASAMLLTWISVERFFSVAFPVWWRVCRTKESAVAAAWAIWALSFCLGVLYGAIRSLASGGGGGRVQDSLISVEFVLTFLLPFLIFTLSNSFIICRPSRPSKKTTKLYGAITLNAVIFLMCWVPYHIFVFVYYRALLDGRPAQCAVGYYGAYYSVCLLHVKSCVIPLIYIFISSELKIKFRESLPSIFERRSSEDFGRASHGYDVEQCALGTSPRK